MGYPDEEGASPQPDSRPDPAPRPSSPWAQTSGGGRHGQAAGPPDGATGYGSEPEYQSASGDQSGRRYRSEPGYQSELRSRIARRRAADAAGVTPGYPPGGTGGYGPGTGGYGSADTGGYSAGGTGGHRAGPAAGYPGADTGGYPGGGQTSGFSAGQPTGYQSVGSGRRAADAGTATASGAYPQAPASSSPLSAPPAGRTGSHRRNPAPGTAPGFRPGAAPGGGAGWAPQPAREPETGRGRRARGRDAGRGGRDSSRGRESGRNAAHSALQPPAGDASRENAWRRPARTAGDEIQGGFGEGSLPGPRDGPGGSLWRAGAFRTAGPGGRGPVRGYPPAPGAPNPVYPPGQFSPWNTPALRTASVAGRAGAGAGLDGTGVDEEQPEYSLLAVSDPSADATATQTWTVLDDSQQTGEWTARAGQPDPLAAGGTGLSTGTGPLSAVRGPFDADTTYPGSPGPAELAGSPGLAEGPAALGAAAFADPGAFPDTEAGPESSQPLAARPGGRLATRPGPPAEPGPDGLPGDEADTGWPGMPGLDPAEDTGWFGTADEDTAASGAGGPRAAGPSAPPAGAPPRGSRSAARGRKPRRPRKPASRARMWLMPVVMMVIAGALVAGAYIHFVKGRTTTSSAASPATQQNSAASSPSPSLGPWKHITTRADDLAALTLAELFPDHFSQGGMVAERTIQKAGKNCTKMVLGKALQTALRKADCTQVMRASYLSTGQKIMATIGVLNLNNVTSAEKAGKATGATAFIKQLPAAKGPTKNLTKGTGLEEAQFKGHYLILTWAEFTNLKVPSGKAQRAKLDAFSRNLVAGTANISLTSRELFGKTQTP